MTEKWFKMPGFWPIFAQAQGAIQEIMGEKIVFETSWPEVSKDLITRHVSHMAWPHRPRKKTSKIVDFWHIRRRKAAKRLAIQP